MVARESSEPAGATVTSRRLLRLASGAAWIVAAVVVGWFLWPTSLGGCTTLTIVSGHSMEPTYYTGDLVVSRCGDPAVGDVVVYNPPDVGGARIIHRIVGGNATDGWLIQGDNNDFLDPWNPTNDRILGSAVLHVPHLGSVAAIVLSPMTWISLLVIALAVVVWPGKGAKEPADGEQPDGDLPDGEQPDGELPDEVPDGDGGGPFASDDASDDAPAVDAPVPA